MAALWFDTATVMLHPTSAALSRWKAVMAARMQTGRFGGIVNNDAEVAGGRDGGWTSIATLHRHDAANGWQEWYVIIMCAADSVEVARGNVMDVRMMMSWNDGLW